MTIRVNRSVPLWGGDLLSPQQSETCFRRPGCRHQNLFKAESDGLPNSTDNFAFANFAATYQHFSDDDEGRIEYGFIVMLLETLSITAPFWLNFGPL